MESKIRNPHTDRLIKIGSKTYKDLIDEGYTREDLIDYTNEPKPIFIKKKILNPHTDRYIDINSKAYKDLIDEGYTREDLLDYTNDPKPIFTTKYVKKYEPNILTSTLASINPYLSPEDLFNLYVSNKDLQNHIDLLYKKTYNQTFIAWLRIFLRERYEHLSKLEKERLRKNEEIKKEQIYNIMQRRKQNQYEEEEILREMKEREEEERKRKEILEDEKRARETYERQERQRQFFTRRNNILENLGIIDRKSWRQWLLKNHPDKGGDKDLCALVIEEGQRKGY